MSRAGGSAILLCEVIEGAQQSWMDLQVSSSQQKNKPGNISLKPSTQYSQNSWTKRVGKEMLPHRAA